MYSCKHCDTVLPTVPAYIRHCRLHSNLPRKSLQCCVDGCFRHFSSADSLKTHISREHRQKRGYSSTKGTLETRGIWLTCPLDFCRLKCDGDSHLLKHLNSHFCHGVDVICPFKSCDHRFRIRSSFASHINRKHKTWKQTDFRSECTVDVQDQPCAFQSSETATAQVDTDSQINDAEETDLEITGDLEEFIPCDHGQFVRNLALFYLRLQAKFFIPTSTADAIIGEILNIKNLNLEHITSQLQSSLTRVGVELENSDLQDVVSHVRSSDLLHMCHAENSVLNTDHRRKEYFKRNFNYVEPVQIKLGIDLNGKHKHYQYVSVRESLNVLFKDQSVCDQYHRVQDKKPYVYSDFTDGSVYQSNAAVTRGRCVNLILYQDAFEVVNPLGSAKSKHKLLGVYFSLGNLIPEYRSRVDLMQLILLCSEKDFKHFGVTKVFSRLVQELKELEVNGIVVSGIHVPVIVAHIAGDNLGSHGLGGFTENFSTAEYFCRFCTFSRTEWNNGQIYPMQPRSILSYKQCVQVLQDTESEGGDNVQGIKADSIFNELKFFHVCAPGLPPCLGHDLFEGIVNFDLALCIKYFVKDKKLFTYNQIQRIIAEFPYRGSDADCKPASISEKKLGGTASQNWCILRMLPFLIGRFIKNAQCVNDSVWNLVLKLRELVQIATSPRIDAGQITYMHACIGEYLDTRRYLFPDVKLRPKHHYLAHYADLTLKCGPLIRLWTLRFESKHQFFKKCIRHSQNFINVSSMLAKRHQFAQAYNSASALFTNKVEYSSSIPLLSGSYCESISMALTSCGQHEDGQAQVSEKVTIHGTLYQRDMQVILAEEEGKYIVGHIILCVVNPCASSVHFLVKRRDALVDSTMGVYILQEAGELVQCVSCDEILDYYPLHCYPIAGAEAIVLKHEPLRMY